MLFSELPADLFNEVLGKLPALIAGAIVSAGSFLLGRWWGRLKAGREWKKKEFFGRVIVSLNIFADGFLKIRTVMEDSLDTVFLNQIAINKVTDAAKRCTADAPILPIAKADRWFLLNFVLNEVAERFAQGQVKQDAGLPVTKIKYALFLTCEIVGEERIRKIRAMLIQEQHLREFPYPDGLPQLENSWHADRIKTLRQAAALYAKEPDNFLTLEVCV
ncbi:hypothetical protein [Limnoglobus roseus]|uniref:Uncharacterized protein n=1 Tax=Limnoglobus roseus TaxID=2598579 RepID=A0A5C1AG67_9BACT|nr:hypothetical protein [Limnoglobus roseus]QEL18419.1 hypothetical protein PX52LOC_05443 [Limnoglobus roseus]